MKQIVNSVFLLFLFTVHSQNFLETFPKEDYNTWGTAQLHDEFGDLTEKLVYIYVTKAKCEDRFGNEELFDVLTVVDFNNNQLSMDVLNDDFEVINIQYMSTALMKDMKTGVIHRHRYWAKKGSTLSSTIYGNSGNKLTPAELILDGEGQEIKFKFSITSRLDNEELAEYNYSIHSWDNSLRKLFSGN